MEIYVLELEMFSKYVLEESVADSILIISFDAKIKIHLCLAGALRNEMLLFSLLLKINVFECFLCEVYY